MLKNKVSETKDSALPIKTIHSDKKACNEKLVYSWNRSASRSSLKLFTNNPNTLNDRVT